MAAPVTAVNFASRNFLDAVKFVGALERDFGAPFGGGSGDGEFFGPLLKIGGGLDDCFGADGQSDSQAHGVIGLRFDEEGGREQGEDGGAAVEWFAVIGGAEAVGAGVGCFYVFEVEGSAGSARDVGPFAVGVLFLPLKGDVERVLRIENCCVVEQGVQVKILTGAKG